MRLAYQELQIDRKKEEKKLQNLEGKKREQAETPASRKGVMWLLAGMGVLTTPC